MTSSTRPIVFFSDFGLQDEFVGVVHGVIVRIATSIKVIDLTHQVPPGDIRSGALTLTRAIQYLPPGVILGVVDPGVGTTRRPLVAVSEHWQLVGPDNGLFAPAVAMVGGAVDFFELSAPEFQLPNPGGHTFDGRDVFAPAAAALAAGLAQPQDLGPSIEPSSVQSLLLPLPEITDGRVSGEVWWVDRFGNLQLNVSPDDLENAALSGQVLIQVGGKQHLVERANTYGSVPDGQPLWHIDSSGMVALAVRNGSAQEFWGAELGQAVILQAEPT